jgi:hypothetical protein
LQICHAAKELCLAAGRVPRSHDTNNRIDTHPALDLRVSAIVTELLESAAPLERELIRTHVDGLLSMLDVMQELTITLIKQEIALHAMREQSA